MAVFICTYILTHILSFEWQESFQPDSLLSFEGMTDIYIGEDFYLDWPRNVTGNSEYVAWVEDNAIKFLTHDGTHIKTIATKGSGPGEFYDITHALVHNKRLYVYSLSQMKMLLYDLETLEFKKETYFKSELSRLFSVDDRENVYFQHLHVPYSKISGVSAFDSEGKKMGEFGESPIFNALNWTVKGGGITVDGSGQVYYAYSGTPVVNRLNPQTGEITELVDPPAFFIEADPARIKNIQREPRKLHGILLRVTRSVAMYTYKDHIFHILEHEGPWMNTKLMEYYVEVWNSDGIKVATGFPIQSKYIFFGDDYLYTLAEGATDILPGAQGNFVRKYKINW